MEKSRRKPVTFRYLLYNYRGVLFNVLFFVYILTAKIPLVKTVAGVMELNQTNIVVGLILIVVTFAELVGIHLKLPVLNSRIGKGEIKRFALFFVIWVFHIVVNMSLVIFGLKAAGIFFENERLSWLPVVFAVFVVLKEIYLLMYFWARPRIKRKVPEARLVIRELTGDALIFCWSAVAFTVTWVYGASAGLVQPGNVLVIILQLVGAMLIFLMMFLPLRLLQFYEEWTTPRTKSQKLWTWLSLSASILAAILILILNLPRW
ncbi:hypothetical protein GF359_10750 [candidate division WOR-3 bacterium]|uniref:Uncharacterized protein n=1 Tax=candidate division WOR-3 bacterium TaxID=2052148 RepID=A0A9D5KCP6_UNCW3|nr:hypothetical protein [candidate division WOR-3 bacterium]MBD3365680.1 hypothetical protein [candidate division WOR-3 bacterium]